MAASPADSVLPPEHGQPFGVPILPVNIPDNSPTSANQQIDRALAQQDWLFLQGYLAAYRSQAGHDAVLADYAEAMQWRGLHHPARALPLYERILATHAGYDFVRLAYAQTLFADKQYQIAEQQFAQINVDKLHPHTAHNLAQYRSRIQQLYRTQANIQANYEYNDNVNQASSLPEIQINGLTLHKTADSLPKQAKGIRFQAQIEHLLPLQQRHHVQPGVSVEGIHYFGHTEYNEYTVRPYLAYVYQSARHTWQLQPFAERAWYGGDGYYRGHGLQAHYIYSPQPQWQMRIGHSLRRLHYDDFPGFNGNRSQSSVTLIYQTKASYLYGGFAYGEEHTQDADQRARRQGIYGGGEYQHSQLGIQTEIALSQRKFQYDHAWAGIPRHDRETRFRLGVFRPTWSWQNITPILNWEASHTNSNIPELYEKQAQRVYFSIHRRF